MSYHIKLLSEIIETPKVGNMKGVCRITGEESEGIDFNKWVKKTFTDWGYLYEGDIISNEAAFCFCEVSHFFAKKIGRDKPQNFRTYSHVITNDNEWLCLTKANKKQIVAILQQTPKVVSITDTGKKHIFFKHRYGFWQLDELHVLPDIDFFNTIHSYMMDCIDKGYNQTELKTGIFKFSTIKKIGLKDHLQIKQRLEAWRGMPMFDFASWLLYKEKK